MTVCSYIPYRHPGLPIHKKACHTSYRINYLRFICLRLTKYRITKKATAATAITWIKDQATKIACG